MDKSLSENHLGQLFQACDLDGSGYIDQSELASICTELTTDELKDVFRELDRDGDGRISVDEFAAGFRGIKEALETKTREKRRERLRSMASEEELEKIDEFVFTMDDSLKTLSCQEQVCELYQNLHASENHELIHQFENIVLGVIKDLRHIQMEKERLETSFKREKEQHDRHLRQLEEEMDTQVQKVAERVKKEEHERSETQKTEMRAQLDNEIVMLQQNLRRLQQEGINKFGREQEDHLHNLRVRLEELQSENRQLKSEVTDSQTNLTLIKSEMTTMRQQLQDKCHEVEMEKQTVMDYIKEQDNLTRQLHLLHDANKKLHDTNDDLREALDVSRQSGGSYRSPSPRSMVSRKGSIMSDYLDTTPSKSYSCNSSLAEELCLSAAERLVSPEYVMVRPPLRTRESHDDSFAEDIDSGHSTLRDVNELDTEPECLSHDGEIRHIRRRYKRLKAGYLPEAEEPDSHDEMDTDAEVGNHAESEYFHNVDKRPSSSGSRGSTRSLRSLPRDEQMLSKHGQRLSRRHNQSLAQEQTMTKITRDPERMYKIVLAGDAAVGKSSFIVRLCKGKFVGNLSSTLGVDFQTKVLDVDGHTVALQLWDTAGQERFRSIAKSYFRRADGVLLLYDCTYERSFLNVRDWVEAVEDGAHKKIPIMLCANKTDLRPEMEQMGRRVVRQEDGQRLAKDFNALFIETSAKDGYNIIEAVIELTRLLRTNEDLEVKTVGMRLDQYGEKKSGTCCGR